MSICMYCTDDMDKSISQLLQILGKPTMRQMSHRLPHTASATRPSTIGPAISHMRNVASPGGGLGRATSALPAGMCWDSRGVALKAFNAGNKGRASLSDALGNKPPRRARPAAPKGMSMPPFHLAGDGDPIGFSTRALRLQGDGGTGDDGAAAQTPVPSQLSVNTERLASIRRRGRTHNCCNDSAHSRL